MRRWLVLVLVARAVASTPAAQQALDRKKIPPPAKTPELRVPAWTKTTLANGADLIVVGEARAAARVVLDHLPRRRGPVRAGWQAGGWRR